MFVFGIDIPLLPELMFILVLLLIAGLIITILEIKKLRKLILTEQADIYKFEADMNKLKPKERERHSKILDGFVETSMSKGMSKAEIENVLMNKGWPQNMIDEAFYRLGK